MPFRKEGRKKRRELWRTSSCIWSCGKFRAQKALKTCVHGGRGKKVPRDLSKALKPRNNRLTTPRGVKGARTLESETVKAQGTNKFWNIIAVELKTAPSRPRILDYCQFATGKRSQNSIDTWQSTSSMGTTATAFATEAKKSVVCSNARSYLGRSYVM